MENTECEMSFAEFICSDLLQNGNVKCGMVKYPKQYSKLELHHTKLLHHTACEILMSNSCTLKKKLAEEIQKMF